MSKETGSWNFKNDEIASDFTNHVNSQLPWYSVATELFTFYASHFIYDGAVVYDFGCSLGNISKELKSINNTKKYRMINVDNSENMQTNFEGVGEFILSDLQSLCIGKFDVGIFFLTIMFLPHKEQLKLLEKAYNSLNDGGVILLLERFTTNVEGYTPQILQRYIHHSKISGGVSMDKAMEKDLSLVGIQRPLSIRQIKRYKPIEIFKVGEFRGFAIHK